ncbi:unnamed protein product [Laminaria digitata]
MITVQGQNRAAVMTSVLAETVGVSRDRAGGFREIALFEGDDAVANLDKLTQAVTDKNARVPCTLFNFLTYADDAMKLGRNMHKHDQASRVSVCRFFP